MSASGLIVRPVTTEEGREASTKPDPAEVIARMHNLVPNSAGNLLICRPDGSGAAIYSASMNPTIPPGWVGVTISAEPRTALRVIAELRGSTD